MTVGTVEHFTVSGKQHENMLYLQRFAVNDLVANSVDFVIRTILKATNTCNLKLLLPPGQVLNSPSTVQLQLVVLFAIPPSGMNRSGHSSWSFAS